MMLTYRGVTFDALGFAACPACEDRHVPIVSLGVLAEHPPALVDVAFAPYHPMLRPNRCPPKVRIRDGLSCPGGAPDARPWPF